MLLDIFESHMIKGPLYEFFFFWVRGSLYEFGPAAKQEFEF